MRSVSRAARPSGSRWVVLAVFAAMALPACSGIGSTPRPIATAPSQGIVAEVASYAIVAQRPSRLLVALITGDNRWVSFGSVDIRFGYLGDGATAPAIELTAPSITARFLAIPGSPEGPGRQPSLTVPADGRGVYAAEVTLARAGYWQAMVTGRLEDGSNFETNAAFTVSARSPVIGVGAIAPKTDNPVLGTPGVALSALDSRAAIDGSIPDGQLHRTSIRRAIELGHPALVVFSTPVYCVSRFCGPVTDLVADLAAEYGDRADFIHIEIYADFQAGVVNQAALDWLQTGTGDLREPWTFLIGADGRIVGSWDTVVTRGELEPLLRALPTK